MIIWFYLSRRDLTVEVVDKSRISQVKVATIEKIIGKRLQLRYYDSKPGSPEREYFGDIPFQFVNIIITTFHSTYTDKTIFFTAFIWSHLTE